MSVLKVGVDRILAITEARRRFNAVVEEVARESDGVFVVTKGGKPVAAVVNVGYLERLLSQVVTRPETARPAGLSPEHIEYAPNSSDRKFDGEPGGPDDAGTLHVVGGLSAGD